MRIHDVTIDILYDSAVSFGLVWSGLVLFGVGLIGSMAFSFGR